MPMPERYFFHLVSPHDVIPDEEGVDMSTDEEALSQIMQAVNEFITEALSCDEWQGWSLEITDGIGKFQQQRLWRTGQLVIHAHKGVRGVQGDRAVVRAKATFNMERRPRMGHFILGKTARVLRGRAQCGFVQETWARIEDVHHHEPQRAPNRGVRPHPGTKHIVRRINP